jgi:hypothetical protein
MSLKFNYQVKMDEMGRTCSTNGDTMNAYRILVEKSEGNIPLGRPRGRWADNIKINLRGLVQSGSIWFRIRTSGGLL